jgi:hypothetical protein
MIPHVGDIERFKVLVGEAVEDLKKIPHPVRIAGPLRTGGDGLKANQRRFELGEALLQSRGLTVFKYGGKYAEAIKAAYDLHIEHFHVPILRSGLIESIFFLQGWESSGGASYERRLCEELGISIGDISHEELSAFKSEHPNL